MSPVIDLPKLKVKPPKGTTTYCSSLVKYEGTELRGMLKTTIQNHEIYYLCASKMKAAAMYIRQVESEAN